MDLCGHAPLATAHCLRTILNYKKEYIIIDTLSGDLIETVHASIYIMNFPSRIPVKTDL